MKIIYYYVIHVIPSELDAKNFNSLSLAFNAGKKYYIPYNENTVCKSYESVSLDNWKIFHDVERERTILDTYKKKERARKEKYIAKEVKADYTPYAFTKDDFTNIIKSEYGYENRRKFPDAKGYYLLKTGDVTIKEDIDKKLLTWSTPVLIQFWSADIVQTKEIKEAGKPYSPAKDEVLNEKAISDWIPIYVNEYDEWGSKKTKLFLTTGDKPFCFMALLQIYENEIEIIENL